MSQSDTNFSAKSSILQTSEIFTIVYTNAIDGDILDLQTKAVKMLNGIRLYKNRLHTIEIDYKGVCLYIEYKIANDSFDHAFGTEHLPDYPEIHSVMCDMQDITEMLVDSQIEDIEQLIKEGLK